MGKITISGSASTAIDGETYTMRASFVVDAEHITEQTRDIGTTYKTLYDQELLFIAIANVGAEDAVLRVNYAPSLYLRFTVPSGGHILLPGLGEVAGTPVFFSAPAVCTLANTSRIKVIIGIS